MRGVSVQQRNAPASTTVFVLAGGQSRRMGVAKASMEVRGEPLIRTVVSASIHLGPVHIVGGPSSLVGVVKQGGLVDGQVFHRPDATQDPGPFGAVITALGDLETGLALVLSCDLAMLRPAHVDRLMAAQRATNADLVVPVIRGRRQWHAMVVAARIVPSLLARRDAGIQALWRGFSGYSESLVVSADPMLFIDVDTPEDIAALRSD